MRLGALQIYGVDYSDRYGLEGLGLIKRHRSEEMVWSTVGSLSSSTYSFAVVVRRREAQVEAGLNMARTVFICVILAIGSQQISGDAERYVRGPSPRAAGVLSGSASSAAASMHV